MKIICRCAIVFGVVVAAWSVSGQVGFGQKRQPGQPAQPGAGTGTAAGLSSVKMIEDPNQRKRIEVGGDLIRDKVWNDAVKVLQGVLDEKKDYYVQVRERDPLDVKKENIRWTSVKFEANNLIGSMDPDGLQTYEQVYGADAKALLDEAKKNGDRQLLFEVAHRFCHTKAGIEANEIAATLSLQRGQAFAAALGFEKLLRMPAERTKLSDLTLYKAAIAFRKTGDVKNYEEVSERLQKNLDGRALKVGDQMVAFAKAKTVLDNATVAEAANRFDWPMVRGDNKNTAQAFGSPPLLDTELWKRPIMCDVLDGLPDVDPDQPAQKRIATAMKQVSELHQPILPGFFPIASSGVLIYRSQRDVRAVALKHIRVKDPDTGDVTETPAGQILWKTIPLKRSLSMLLEKKEYRDKAESWLDLYQQLPGFTSFLYDNSLLGTISTDHKLVYVIDDLAVPPHPNLFQPFAFNNPQLLPQNMKGLMMQNELHAYDIITGKLRWDLNEKDAMFKDSHFLSMPISIGGKLYVLNEKLIDPNQGVGVNPFGGGGLVVGGEAELRLICLDPSKIGADGKPAIVGEPQSLGNVLQYNRFVQDISRRVNAIHLGYGEGTLVCPTNAGEIFGIDLMTRSLVWSYPYRETAHVQIQLPGVNFNPGFPQPPQPKMMGSSPQISKWKPAPPAIQDGKIVFTAPDSDSVHCISLRDGKPIWKRAQIKGDLYMAGVHQGRVLIVGETQVRILDLKTGSQITSITTGDLPSGQGVASKGVYYQPLKRGEILAIDIAKGEIKAHNRASGASTAPGNLVFYDGMVLSQTPTDLVAYAMLSTRLEMAKADVAKEPENFTKLSDYGDLLLKDGQVHLAVETLLKVHDSKPQEPLAKRVRSRLFEAITDLMQLDFPKASKDYLTIYESLCSVPGNPGEEQQRLAKFLRLVGQGRETEGNLVAAFQMYKKFGGLQLHRDNGGITTPEDPNTKIPVNVWLRGRISGMLAKATPAQREPLEASIAEEWKTVEAKKDVESIRTFVGMFDVPVKVGREARVRLAETIMERNDRGSFLEAEMLLFQVTASDYRKEPESGGRALAVLAKLEETKGSNDSLRLAAAYYRELARDFTNIPVRGKLTGADLLNELATDKRFLPYLEEGTNPWGPVKIGARQLPRDSFKSHLMEFVMQPEGDQTPFARQHRLMLDFADAANPRLRLRDLTTGNDRWTTNLGQVPLNQHIFFNLYQQSNVNSAYFPNARYRFFQVKGHLVVCQVGAVVYCIDGDSGKKLWEMPTVESFPQANQVQLNELSNDPEGNPIFGFWNIVNGSRYRFGLGRIGAVQASYVAVVGHKGLVVVEPLRGGTMWKKPDVPGNSHVFGDDQYLFLVETNENGALGAGRTLRASDGEVQNCPDFSAIYQARLRVNGRKILAHQSAVKEVTLRYYDIVAGKDVWSKQFPAGSHVLQTEDATITGVIDLKGNLTVLNAETGKELLTTNLCRHRITLEDVKTLQNPLLLQDGDRYYIALNKPIDNGNVGNGMLHNNFSNGARCLPVNGWFVFVQKHDGSRKTAKGEITWKKGDVSHSSEPVVNQLIVMEQFDQSPVIIFTARFNEFFRNGNRWVSNTQSLDKTTAEWVHEWRPENVNGLSPLFSSLQVDMKSRTVNMISAYGPSIQFYVDDGKAPPPLRGAQLNPGGPAGGTDVAMPSVVVPNPLPGAGGRMPIAMPIRRGFPAQPIVPIAPAPPAPK